MPRLPLLLAVPALFALTGSASGNEMRWNEAQFVFTGKLEAVQAGPVGHSFPPMYTHRLHLTVDKVLRGDLKPGQRLTGSHVARQEKEPRFPEGKLCLVAASEARGTMRIERIEEADSKSVAAAKLLCSLPLGWKFVDGSPASPWASLKDFAWPKDAKLAADSHCAKTGRPALFAGPGIRG